MITPSNTEIAVIDFDANATDDEYVAAYRTLRDAGYMPLLPPKYAIGLANFTKLGMIQETNTSPQRGVTS